MEYYSAIKKNETMPFAAILMDLKGIMLSKKDREKQIPYDPTYVWNLKKTFISNKNYAIHIE